MSTDTYLLMGEVVNDPEGQEKDVEQLLVGLLKALIDEQVLQASKKLTSEGT